MGPSKSQRASFEAPSGLDAVQRVRQILGLLLAHEGGAPDIRTVAARVGTSVRTLQRRLSAGGLTYAGAVKQARYSAARTMLADRRRRIGDIARTLGYSDHAHFTRAFQRWTGITPRDFRCRVHRPAVGSGRSHRDP